MQVPLASPDGTQPDPEHVYVHAHPAPERRIVEEVPTEPVEIVVPVEPPIVEEELPPAALTPEMVIRLQRQAQVFLALRTVLGFIEIVLGLRFLLALFGANPESMFYTLVYDLSVPFVFLFEGLFRNPASGPVVFELTTLFAMLFYLFAYWWGVRLVRLLLTPPVIRR